MIPSIRSSAPHHAGALAQLSEALEQQQQALRATLSKLEAELPPEAVQRLRQDGPELPDSSPLGRQVRKLRQLLRTPLRLSAEPLVVSAETQLNVEVLRTRIADALFDQVRRLREAAVAGFPLRSRSPYRRC